MGRRRTRGIRRVTRVVVLVAVGLGLWRGADVLWGANLACIVDHEAYRSAQLSAAELEDVVQRLGIRSVVNLRGTSDAGWYRREAARCEQLEVTQYDVALSARRLPEPEALARLVEILHEAPRPVLFHCKNGADRTGLAAALYLEIEAGVDPRSAESEGLSLWRGHLNAGATANLNELYRLRQDHEPTMEFSRWVREVYPALYVRAVHKDGTPG